MKGAARCTVSRHRSTETQWERMAVSADEKGVMLAAAGLIGVVAAVLWFHFLVALVIHRVRQARRRRLLAEWDELTAIWARESRACPQDLSLDAGELRSVVAAAGSRQHSYSTLR